MTCLGMRGARADCCRRWYRYGGYGQLRCVRDEYAAALPQCHCGWHSADEPVMRKPASDENGVCRASRRRTKKKEIFFYFPPGPFFSY